MKRRKLAILIFCLTLIVACNPKSKWPGMWFGKYANYIPTNTPSDEPYETATPVPTPNPTQAVKAMEFLYHVKDFLEDYKEIGGSYIEAIHYLMINPSTGYLEIKLETSTTVFEQQPFISFRLLQSISQLFDTTDFRDDFKEFTNADEFVLNLTTVANERGRYEYNSITRWELMEHLSNQSISFEEWMSEANAGFVP